MPIGAFNRCLSGDLSRVSKNKYYSYKKARRIWASLFDQHLAAHGLPEPYVKYLEKRTKAAAFYDEAYHGKRWQLVRARICEAEAESMLAGEGEKIETMCARISKFMGFPVRADDCNVVEFYNYVAIMGSS